MPAEQLVLPTAAPPDKGEFEGARVAGQQLFTHLSLSPDYAQRMARQSFLENADPQQAGQNQSLDFSLHAAGIADIYPTTVTSCCKFTLCFLHYEDAGSCLCAHIRQKEIIASSVCRGHSGHSGSLLVQYRLLKFVLSAS